MSSSKVVEYFNPSATNANVTPQKFNANGLNSPGVIKEPMKGSSDLRTGEKRIVYETPKDINFEEEQYLRDMARARIENTKLTPLRGMESGLGASPSRIYP